MYQLYESVVIPGDDRRQLGTGWLPALPDLRDYGVTHPDIEPMTKKLGVDAPSRSAESLPPQADLRQWCSPVESQGNLGACTAHAAVGIVEYYQRRAFGRHLEGSRRFVYKATRNLMQVKGDTGAFLRSAMGAIALCGVPEEKYWPYTDKAPDFDEEPPPFCYALGDEFKAVKYFCHDPQAQQPDPTDVLGSVKTSLAGGIPAMFGFWGFPSWERGDVPGGVPYPCPGERAIWGHAVAAVGYDDTLTITNTEDGSSTTGAIMLRNSWGTIWGDGGYGWLPYRYVLDRLACDFWSLLGLDWVNTEQFGL
jgi:C1A family cysteine protease